MRRLVGVLLTAAAIMSVMIGGTAARAGTRPAADPAACTGPVQVTSFTFAPSTVTAGANATATLVLRNCTSTAVSVRGSWAAHYTAPGVNGVPPGCTAIDPIAQQTNVPPNGTASQ